MRDDAATLKWTPGKQEGITILEVTGPITLANLFAFQQELAAVKPRVLIMDLTQSPYMDSAGLGAVLRYHVSAESRGGKLLLCGANQRVNALLETANVHLILKSFPTVEAAEASVS